MGFDPIGNTFRFRNANWSNWFIQFPRPDVCRFAVSFLNLRAHWQTDWQSDKLTGCLNGRMTAAAWVFHFYILHTYLYISPMRDPRRFCSCSKFIRRLVAELFSFFRVSAFRSVCNSIWPVVVYYLSVVASVSLWSWQLDPPKTPRGPQHPQKRCAPKWTWRLVF